MPESLLRVQGVELSHRAVLDTVFSLAAFMYSFKVQLGSEDVFLSYLPLAHIFDRLGDRAVVYCFVLNPVVLTTVPFSFVGLPKSYSFLLVVLLGIGGGISKALLMT